MADVGEKLVLAEDLDADGVAVHCTQGGEFAWMVCGTLSSGNEAKLQILGPDGSTYLDVVGSQVDKNSYMVLTLPKGFTAKMVIVGTPTDVYAWLVKI